MNTKLWENSTQIALMLCESFNQGLTISFVTIFNISFGLVMSIQTFSEAAGSGFAAKREYVFVN